MVLLLPTSIPIHLHEPPPITKLQFSPPYRHDHRIPFPSTRRLRFCINATDSNSSLSLTNQKQEQQPRTLFPGGFKRPEIKVPTLILQLNTNDVFDKETMSYVDVIVSKWVGIIVLNGGNDGGGGRLYEAACLLKSVIKERAYLLVFERVDIAAAVDASGVLLSDQGLPAIVARNMMMESKSKSVVLPLVARTVGTAEAALSASNSEGADFLVYSGEREEYAEVLLNSVVQRIKIPVFTSINLEEDDTPLTRATELLKSGASGLVVSLESMRMFTDDSLSKLFSVVNLMENSTPGEFQSFNKYGVDDDSHGKNGAAGFIKLEESEKQFIEMEKSVLGQAISVIRKAAPLMEEVSLLIDAVSQLDDPFLLVIAGEFNSGKSSVINALLGRKYLAEGVIPTTNEITLLCYSDRETSAPERCEKHPDGQYICYLPAPILKNMNLVDTPGTNVILQRQQRLTEEFVPRADLLLFVLSADRPLTESEVAFLHYIQQWKKKVVFVLNKADLYQNDSELEEAIAFIKENAQKLLKIDGVMLYPVSARSAIKAKQNMYSVVVKNHEEHLLSDPLWRSSGFHELESFLLSFLDGSTDTGMERMQLKLGTPVGILDQLLSSCESLVRKDFESANQDLLAVREIISGVKDYTIKMESESSSWKRQILSLIDSAKVRATRKVESTLKLSNLDLAASYVFKGERSGLMPVTSSLQNDIIDPALTDAQKLLGEYSIWLQSNLVRQEKLYKETFENRWPSLVNQNDLVETRTYELQRKEEGLSSKVLESFSASAAATLFEQELREVFFETFGGLGAAGISASLLTSVLPTTSEDLLALGLCSAGGFFSISKFPIRRKLMIEKVKKIADALALELEEAMQKDLTESINNLESFVKLLSKPYQDTAQQTVERLTGVQDELISVEKSLRKLQVDIQNLHVP